MQRSSAIQLASAEVTLNNICGTCRNLNEALRFEFRNDNVWSDMVLFDRKLDDLYSSYESGCRFLLYITLSRQILLRRSF